MSIHRYANQSLRRRIMVNDLPSWLCKHKRSAYIISAVIASPPYISPCSFSGLLARRNALTVRTGVQHVLDHIIPLNHPKVCGLNVPWNIQVVPAYRNAVKSNVWIDDDAHGWFHGPEQFSFQW